MRNTIFLIGTTLLSFNLYAQSVEDQINQNNAAIRADHKNNFKSYPLAYTKTGQKSFDQASVLCSARAIAIYNRSVNKDYEDYTYQFNNCMSQYIPFKENNDCLAGQSITFGTGGSCRTTLTATIFDGNNTGFLNNENSGFTGSANFKCEKGVLSPISETCTAAPAGDCNVEAEQVFTMEIENKDEVGLWRTEKMNTCTFKIPAQQISGGGSITVMPEVGLRVDEEYGDSNFRPLYEGQLTATCSGGTLVVQSQTCKAKVMNCLNRTNTVVDNIVYSQAYNPAEIKSFDIKGKQYKSIFQKAGEADPYHLSVIQYIPEYMDLTKNKESDLLVFKNARNGFKYFYADSVFSSNTLLYLADRWLYQESFINTRHIKSGESITVKLFNPYFSHADIAPYANSSDYYVDEQTWAVIPNSLSYQITNDADKYFRVQKNYDNNFVLGDYGYLESYKNMRGDTFNGSAVLSCHDGMILVEELNFSVNETPSCTNHELYFTNGVERPLAWTMSNNKYLNELCPMGDFCEAARTYKERGSYEYDNPYIYSRVQFTDTGLRAVQRPEANLLQDEMTKIKGLTCHIDKPLEKYPLGQSLTVPVNDQIKFRSESGVYSGETGFTCRSRKGMFGVADVYYFDMPMFDQDMNNGYHVSRETNDTCHFVNEAEQFQKCYFVGTPSCESKILENGEKFSCSEVDPAELQCVDGLIGKAQ